MLHPAAAQQVYRCEEQGKVEYSHRPCLNARAVDTTATRGLDKSSGVSRKGADVSREEFREQFAGSLKPLTGMTPEQFATFSKRQKLSAPSQQECRKLDARQPFSGSPADVLALRQRFHELGC